MYFSIYIPASKGIVESSYFCNHQVIEIKCISPKFWTDGDELILVFRNSEQFTIFLPLQVIKRIIQKVKIF